MKTIQFYTETQRLTALRKGIQARSSARQGHHIFSVLSVSSVVKTIYA